MTTLLQQAAFTIETLAHLQGHEELLPQAEHLRRLFSMAEEIPTKEDELLDDASMAAAGFNLVLECLK